MKIYIVGCGATKTAMPQPAARLYTGSLFRAALNYAVSHHRHGDTVLILSAKHGLLPLDSVKAPYDTRWNDVDAVGPSDLRRQIEGRDWKRAHFVMLCALPYATHLLDAYRDLHREHADFEAPLRGLGIGQQTKWLWENARQRACRCCGCTQEKGCGFGCWWVEYDLCSACKNKKEDNG